MLLAFGLGGKPGEIELAFLLLAWPVLAVIAVTAFLFSRRHPGKPNPFAWLIRLILILAFIFFAMMQFNIN